MAMRLLLLLSTALHLLATFFPIRAHGLYGGAYLTTITNPTVSVNGIPFSTRAYWMRRANSVLAELESPCPFAAFATVIVNHTETGLGHEVCIGVNSNSITGNPTLHGQLFKSVNVIQTIADTIIGEIAAISNCSRILTDPSGSYNLTATAALSAFSQLSLYTNAESCTMVRSQESLLFSVCLVPRYVVRVCNPLGRI